MLNWPCPGRAWRIFDATAVAPEGRLSWAGAGFYDGATQAVMGRDVQAIDRLSSRPIRLT